MAVFIPVFLLEGVAGKMFKPLAFAIVAALGASIIAASVIAPVLSSYFLKGGKGKMRGRSQKMFIYRC